VLLFHDKIIADAETISLHVIKFNDKYENAFVRGSEKRLPDYVIAPLFKPVINHRFKLVIIFPVICNMID